jgi:hypothetical protein
MLRFPVHQHVAPRDAHRQFLWQRLGFGVVKWIPSPSNSTCRLKKTEQNCPWVVCEASTSSQRDSLHHTVFALPWRDVVVRSSDKEVDC